jgi:peptidoglycan/LPS O-acetylase OafA/YrhL
VLIAYRADIDGLRAVAILSVVVFHAIPSYLPGGFTGVDIFFAISGFLITRIILEENASSHFTFVKFWIRRARRILPALFFMLFAATAAAFLLLMPYDLKEYGELLAHTVLFAANIFLGNEKGYFAPEGQITPLHHVWSLSVEEQYYLVWPIILIAAVRNLPIRLVTAVVIALLLISLSYSQWATENDAKLAFYGLPSRAFELLTGAIVAVVQPARLGARTANILSITGLLLISCGFFTIGDTSRFPGLLALIPCSGAALLILSGGQAKLPLVNRLLSGPIPVHIGKISYSWYLWHWPPLAFFAYCVERPIHLHETALLLMLGFAMAEFSYRYIETPFRRQVAPLEFRQSFLPATVICCVLLVSFGLGFQYFQGVPSRLNPETLAVYNKFSSKDPSGCNSHSVKIEGGSKECLFGSNAQAPAVMLWGDSHAEHYLPAVANIAASEGVQGIFRRTFDCRPFIDSRRIEGSSPKRQKCADYNEKTVEMLRTNPGLPIVILAARWSGHPTGTIAFFEQNLERTVAALQQMGKKVVMLGQVPRRPIQPRNCMTKQVRFGIQIPNCERSLLADHDQYEKDLWAAMGRLVRDNPGLVLFSPEKHICDATSCGATDERGEPLYRDNSHLNELGAYFLQSHIDQVIRNHLRAFPSQVITSHAP